MKLSYLRKDHSFISSLEAIKTDHSYVYPDGIQDVNFPIWMMYFGIMNPFLGVMNSSDMNGSTLVTAAYNMCLPHNIGKYLIAVGIMFFAFTTILGWNYYGERCLVI